MKRLIFAFAVLAVALTAVAQENSIKRLPEVNDRYGQKVYTDNATGFWGAAEVSGAYSCRLFNSNFSLAEVDVTGGYRFSEFLRAGIGVGVRTYFDNDKVRYTHGEWAFPIYLDIRGNFIPTLYRSVVPYYSFDIGGTVRDGFMIRPTVGWRIGQPRQAFLVGLSYLGQDLKSFEGDRHTGLRTAKRRFVSFVSLRLGYEF